MIHPSTISSYSKLFTGIFTVKSMKQLESLFDKVYIIPKKEWMSKFRKNILNHNFKHIISFLIVSVSNIIFLTRICLEFNSNWWETWIHTKRYRSNSSTCNYTTFNPNSKGCFDSKWIWGTIMNNYYMR